MEFQRGDVIGHGSFGSVNLAIPTKNNTKKLPPLMAVKSCSVSNSSYLMNEKEILSEICGCENVIKCYGDTFTVENGVNLYNLFLEYAVNGSLSDLVNKSGGQLPELEVRRYVKSILKGVKYIHEKGYVHCDIKIQNILLCSENGKNVVKIADFGLAKTAKRDGEDNLTGTIRGTPVNMSPESVIAGEYEAPTDVWAIGCAVIEMFTGKSAWRCSPETDVKSLLFRIGVGEELPEIPDELSVEGKDFVRKCFVKDPVLRWTAEMLLDHPFAQFNDTDDEVNSECIGISVSPRCPFDVLGWISIQSFSECDELLFGESNSTTLSSPINRIQQLVSSKRHDWSSTNTWVTVR